MKRRLWENPVDSNKCYSSYPTYELLTVWNLKDFVATACWDMCNIAERISTGYQLFRRLVVPLGCQRRNSTRLRRANELRRNLGKRPKCKRLRLGLGLALGPFIDCVHSALDEFSSGWKFVASHAGIFRGARISSLTTRNTSSPKNACVGG